MRPGKIACKFNQDAEQLEFNLSKIRIYSATASVPAYKHLATASVPAFCVT